MNSISTNEILKTSNKVSTQDTKVFHTKLKAPFAWIGGKSILAKDIIALMPKHKSYIEVFGGALSVFYQN